MRTDMENEQPTSVLKSEHQIILRVIEVLKHLVVRSESGVAFERESFGECVEFMRLFADACHHAKEEDLLFPALEARGIPRDGGPIGVMLEEHRIARVLTEQMGEALEAYDRGESGADSQFHTSARQYADLLTQHIYKEDNILFNMGDNLLTGDDQASLCSKFCEVGCRAFGGKTRDQLVKIADTLETRWDMA